MPVLDRDSLQESTLADLHAIASELGIDGYRRLRKDDLIDAVVEKQAGGGKEGRSSGGSSSSGSRQRSRPDRDKPDFKEQTVEGTVELRKAGSAFLKVATSGWEHGDVFISAAQVRRCELTNGAEVSGPVRPPRRSERYPSLVRIELVNGKEPAKEVTKSPSKSGGKEASKGRERSSRGRERVRKEPVLPSELFAFPASAREVAKTVALVPFGKGSRVTIAGPAFSGKSELARSIAVALKDVSGIKLSVALSGVRPEELPIWVEAGVNLIAKGTIGSRGGDERAIKKAIDDGKRGSSRGDDSVVIVDSLSSSAARDALAAAVNVAGSGSLTVIVVTAEPVGGETTVIYQSGRLAGARKYPALDLHRSGTIRPDLLVGERGVSAISKAVSKYKD